MYRYNPVEHKVSIRWWSGYSDDDTILEKHCPPH